MKKIFCICVIAAITFLTAIVVPPGQQKSPAFGMSLLPVRLVAIIFGQIKKPHPEGYSFFTLT